MERKHKKGLKPLIIKQVAMLMGVCYLLNPLHQQCSDLLHALTHGLEIPSVILTHDSVSKTHKNVHVYQEHRIAKEEHLHSFITFFNTIFKKANTDSDQNDSSITHYKIDKHFLTGHIHCPQPFVFRLPDKVYQDAAQLLNGHPYMLYEPPRSI